MRLSKTEEEEWLLNGYSSELNQPKTLFTVVAARRSELNQKNIAVALTKLRFCRWTEQIRSPLHFCYFGLRCSTVCIAPDVDVSTQNITSGLQWWSSLRSEIRNRVGRRVWSKLIFWSRGSRENSCSQRTAWIQGPSTVAMSYDASQATNRVEYPTQRALGEVTWEGIRDDTNPVDEVAMPELAHLRAQRLELARVALLTLGAPHRVFTPVADLTCEVQEAVPESSHGDSIRWLISGGVVGVSNEFHQIRSYVSFFYLSATMRK